MRKSETALGEIIEHGEDPEAPAAYQLVYGELERQTNAGSDPAGATVFLVEMPPVKFLMIDPDSCRGRGSPRGR